MNQPNKREERCEKYSSQGEMVCKVHNLACPDFTGEKVCEICNKPINPNKDQFYCSQAHSEHLKSRCKDGLSHHCSNCDNDV